jgi:DNA-binding PadR family transcriptional regulator
MASKTDDAILGMLTVSPMTGYDMKKFSEQSLTHFWHESFGNLYPRLKRLEADGLVRGRREARSHGPDATVYSLTEAGRDRFDAWLEEDPEPERIRNELLLKVFFSARGKLATCRRRIEAHRREQVALLARYEEIGRLADEQGEGRPEGPFWRLSLRRGVLLTEARIRWCDECLDMLTELIEEE